MFDREDVEAAGEINCQICGKSECLKCKSSHPNYTCEEWKQRNTLNLQKLKIKQCPQCSNGITKNGAWNHLECRNCKAHICWKCLKFFGTSKECYDHLAKYCGGIFDPNDIYWSPFTYSSTICVNVVRLYLLIVLTKVHFYMNLSFKYHAVHINI